MNVEILERQRLLTTLSGGIAINSVTIRESVKVFDAALVPVCTELLSVVVYLVYER